VLERRHVRLLPERPAGRFNDGVARDRLERPLGDRGNARPQQSTPSTVQVNRTVQVNSYGLSGRSATALPSSSLFRPLSWSNMQARRAPGWADIVGSALLVLAVAVPAMIIEESSRSRPTIDQPTHLSIIALGLIAIAFFAGGAVAAFRRPSKPTRYAAATGFLAGGVLLAGAVCLRLLLAHGHITGTVQHLWMLGVITALIMSLAGSFLGRLFTR
jgi:hypothetical protein